MKAKTKVWTVAKSDVDTIIETGALSTQETAPLQHQHPSHTSHKNHNKIFQLRDRDHSANHPCRNHSANHLTIAGPESFF